VSLGSIIAVVDYNDTLFTTGWDTLALTTNASFSDEDQAYFAGFVEGAATFKRARDTLKNGNAGVPANQSLLPANVTAFIEKNWAWMELVVAQKNATSSFWLQVGLQMRQYQGLLDGLNSVAPKTQTFSFLDLAAMNMEGDLMDIFAKMNISTLSNWRTQSKKEFERNFMLNTHCSALVKLLYDSSDIFFGHATWSTYNAMVRMYKHYTLNYASAVAKTVSFSGYAGVLASIDDFYVTSTKLAVTETSFSILNMSLYEYVTHRSVFYWIRVSAANRLAASAPEWVEIFSTNNSGTYNNQWIVFDTKRFTPGKDLLKDTLWIAEQIPGEVGTQDVTEQLQYGYWPSYNIPSIPSLYVKSGNQEAAQTQGWEMNDYQRCVRAQIFRRDQSSVVDLRSFQFMMQYNNYQQDSVSQFNPTYAVAARGDIAAPGNFPMCFGAIDAKTTSWKMIHEQHGRVEAYSGPTPQQPPFDFNSTKATMMCTPHDGEPGLWNFSFVPMTPPNF
jgi:hypothetical protein